MYSHMYKFDPSASSPIAIIRDLVVRAMISNDLAFLDCIHDMRLVFETASYQCTVSYTICAHRWDSMRYLSGVELALDSRLRYKHAICSSGTEYRECQEEYSQSQSGCITGTFPISVPYVTGSHLIPTVTVIEQEGHSVLTMCAHAVDDSL